MVVFKYIIAFLVWNAIFCVGWRLACLLSWMEAKAKFKNYMNLMKGK